MSLKTRRLTLRLPEDLWTRLHYRAEVEGLPFSAILRRDVSQANARWRPPAPSTSGLSLTWDTNAHHKRGEDTMNRELSVSSHGMSRADSRRAFKDAIQGRVWVELPRIGIELNRELSVSSHDDPHEPDHNSDEGSRRAPHDTAPRDQEPDEPAEDGEDFVDEHTAWFYEGEPSVVLEAVLDRLTPAVEPEPTDLKEERRDEGPPDEAAETVHKQEVLTRWAEADAVARSADAVERAEEDALKGKY